MASSRILVVGAGAFGLSAALELRRRGHEVVLVDPGPLPHADAASNDVSKLIRADYGGDVLYTELMELALTRWRAQTSERPRPLFHETGLVCLTRSAMMPGEFEHDSFTLLSARGYPLERLNCDTILARFPAFSEGGYLDGYFNPVGGWAESGEVLRALIAEARLLGVELREGVRARRLPGHAHLDHTGIECADGTTIEADHVVVTTGAWVCQLLPELADRVRAIGQPVFLLRPADPAPFRPPHFVPFTAEIARSGWYGFSATRDGLVKIAHHGPGIPVELDAPRLVPAAFEARLRSFLAEALPALADAPLHASRLCLYGDSFDGDFIIARVPERPGVTVAAGDSGHAFKFTPVLGELIADAVLGAENRFLPRFRWRERTTPRTEAARAVDH
ncbi:MAG: FAD-dependent oxidoreductase [Myxococcales bacterium]|nr:FAD-dependent oxidoreductase [Myxococcales bacterium]